MTDEMRRFYVREFRVETPTRVERGWDVVDRDGYLPPRRFRRGWAGRDTSLEGATECARNRNECEVRGGHIIEMGGPTRCQVCDATVEPDVEPYGRD